MTALWTAVPVPGVASYVVLLTKQEPLGWAFGTGFLAPGVIFLFMARATRRRAKHTSQ